MNAEGAFNGIPESDALQPLEVMSLGELRTQLLRIKKREIKKPEAIVLHASSNEDSPSIFAFLVHKEFALNIPTIYISDTEDIYTSREHFLDLGGDYILPKSEGVFLKQLLVSLKRRSLLRKEIQPEPIKIFDHLTVDVFNRKAFWKEEDIEFTSREFSIFLSLVERCKKMGTESPIVRYGEFKTQYGTVPTHDSLLVSISLIRKKLTPFGIFVKTKHNIGYYITQTP